MHLQWRSQVPAFGGGQDASEASKDGGPGACPRENFWGPRPSDAWKMKETPFSDIFCIINIATNNTKQAGCLLNLDREFMLIVAISYSRKEKEEFLFSYKWSSISNTNYKMDLLLSFTVKWFGADRLISIIKDMPLFTTLSGQSTASLARNICKRNCCCSLNYFKQIGSSSHHLKRFFQSSSK